MTLKQKLPEFPFFTLSIVSILFIILFFVFESDFKIDKVSLNENKTEQIRSIARKTFETCREQSGSVCYEQIVTSELLPNYKTQEILEAVYDYDEYFSCHAFIHFLGRALYRKLESIADVYAESDFTCHGGIYHGAMEAFLDQNRTKVSQLTNERIKDICSDSRAKTAKNPGQVYTECLHGFGHTFMYIVDGDLPKALDYCNTTPTYYTPPGDYTTPTYYTPGTYSTPYYPTPSYYTPGGGYSYPSPSYYTPGYSYPSPSYGTPSYGTPSYGTPTYGTPSYGTPSYETPSYSTPPLGAKTQRSFFQAVWDFILGK